ncbi:hypothetical protein Esti_005718 [Eimeria stiedai]
MNNEAFNAAVSSLTTLRVGAPATCDVDTTVNVAALSANALPFLPAVETARCSAADEEGLSTHGAAPAFQRSRLTSDFPLALLQQEPRGSFASYLPDAPILTRAQSSYDAAASSAPVPGACNLQQDQQQQHQSQNYPVHIDSAAADRRASEEGFGNTLGFESEAFCALWGPPREALQQQQLRLESLQQTINYCDERCTLRRSFRAREAAVRARLLYDQLHKQQQEQRLRHQRNAKLMEEAVSSTNQTLMAHPPHAAQRLALCLTELHKQMQQRLDPPTFAAVRKIPGFGGTGALYPLNVLPTFQQENRYFSVQGCGAGSSGGAARTTVSQTCTIKSGQTMSALYDSAEDLAAAKKTIKTRASILLKQQESANRNNVQRYPLAESGVQAHVALQCAKGSYDASKCVTEAATNKEGCTTCCSSPRIPEELSIACTKPVVPPSPPQKLINYSERFCCSSSNRQKSTGLPRKTSRPTNDKARRHTATKNASEEYYWLKFTREASALGVLPVQLHNTQQVRLRQQQRSKRHHNNRQSLKSCPEGGSPERLLASPTPVNGASRVLIASHATKGGLDSAPSETLWKDSTSALDVALEQTSQGEQQGPVQAKSLEDNHQRHHRRRKQHLQKNEGQLHEQQIDHHSKPMLTEHGPCPPPQDAGARTFSSRSSSRSLASRATSSSQGIHYLRSEAKVSQRPSIHSITRVVPLQHNTTTSPTSLKAQSTAKLRMGAVPPRAKRLTANEYDNADSHDTPKLTEQHVRHYSASCTSKAEPPAASSSAASREEALPNKEPLNQKLSTPGTQPTSSQAICGSISSNSKVASLDITKHNGTLVKGHSSTNDLVTFLMEVE